MSIYNMCVSRFGSLRASNQLKYNENKRRDECNILYVYNIYIYIHRYMIIRVSKKEKKKLN